MLRLVRAGFGALCVLKTFDLYERLPKALDDFTAAVIVVAWLTSATLVTMGRLERLALPGIILAGAASFILTNFSVYNQHMTLLISIAVTLLVFRPNEQLLLLRAQLSVVYAFAFLAKLNGPFLSGAVLEGAVLRRPAGQALGLPDIEQTALAWMLRAAAATAVATEAWLGIGLWMKKTRVVTAYAGVLFHTGMIVLMAREPASAVRMAVFSGAMLLLYLPFFATTLPSGPTAQPSSPPHVPVGHPPPLGSG